jgi:drug/metabolite transporter (DMT)-like permease
MSDNRRLGTICIILTTLFWGMAPVFTRYFSKDLALDPFTQNFFRYLAAMCFLWIVSGLFLRSEIKAAMRKPQRFILPIVVLVVLQIFWVLGLRHIQPAIAMVISRFRVVICAVGAYYIFHDERLSIRDPRFILGTLIALGGTTVLALAGGVRDQVYLKGVFLIFCCALIGAGYTLVIKLLRDLNPVAAFTMISTGVTMSFFILMIFFGDAATVLGAGPMVKFLLAFSGILCLGIAHSLLYTATNSIGVAVSSSFTAASPIVTAIIAYFVFSDKLSPIQIVAGVGVMVGSFLILKSTKTGPTQSI